MANAVDSGAGLFYEANAVEQVGHEGVSPDATVTEVRQRHALRQTAGAYDLDTITVDLDEDVGSVNEPVAVHHSVGDRFAHCPHRILRHFLAPQTLDAIGEASVALDEAYGVFDVGDDSAIEILAVQNVYLVGSFGQQAGHIRLRKEAACVLCEEKHASVAKEQFAVHAFSGVGVNQHVRDVR